MSSIRMGLNRLCIGILLCSTLLLGTIIVSSLFDGSSASGGEMLANSKTRALRIALVGASVGKAWDFPGLPYRIGLDGYEFEYVGKYKFDKSDEIAALLSREKDKPDAIVIKECAAFFPGDLLRYQELIKLWVSWCRASGVTPVLATVVPVARTYPLRTFFLELLHARFRYPGGTQDAIIRYNDWIKEYAAKEKIPVLDLEAAVRRNDHDRHLAESLARKDGLHLRADAYRRMDMLVRRLLEQLELAERKSSL